MDGPGARSLVEQADELEPRGETLTHYEHAIWRAKGETAIEVDEPDPGT